MWNIFFNPLVEFFSFVLSFLFYACLSSGFKHTKHQNLLRDILKSQIIKSLIFQVRHLSQFSHISAESSLSASTELFYMD